MHAGRPRTAGKHSSRSHYVPTPDKISGCGCSPRNLRPAPPPLETDTVDLSLLPVSELPDTIWRATSLFRTAEEVAAHLPRPRGDQVLPFVLLKGEVWAFHDLSDARGPFKQAVDPTTAERLGAARLLKSDDKNIYVAGVAAERRAAAAASPARCPP